MGIIYPSDRDWAQSGEVQWKPGGNSLCFYCGSPIFGLKAFVYWHGHAADRDPVLLLHNECAVNLSVHLAKDGTLAEYNLKAVPAE